MIPTVRTEPSEPRNEVFRVLALSGIYASGNDRWGLFARMDRVREELRGWGVDAILCAGNLTRSRVYADFAVLHRDLVELREQVGGAGQGPMVLAVPGPLDLDRERELDAASQAFSEYAFGQPEVQEELQHNPRARSRAAKRRAMEPFKTWCLDLQSLQPQGFSFQITPIPGEFTATRPATRRRAHCPRLEHRTSMGQRPRALAHRPCALAPRAV